MKTVVIPLQGLDCVDCARVIETSLKRMPGVQDARLDFARAELTVEGNADPELLRERIRQLGFTPLTAHARASTSLTFAGFWKTLITDRTLRSTLPGLLLLLVSLFLPRLGVNGTWRVSLQLVALAAAGYPIFLRGLRSLFLDRRLTINFLLTLAVIGAVVINETPEAFIILILFHLSEAMEAYTNDHARAVLTEFADLAPKSAVRLTESGEEVVPIEKLTVGDLIIVRAGERFPMDGIISAGSSEINQAPITGESRLIPKQAGDTVISGTINGQGVLKVRVSALAQDTTVQRIVNLVLDARAVKARQEKFIDRFAAVYTPIVVAVALLTALVPTLLLGQPLWNNAGEYGWLHRALSLLMIGCPCALVVSTPVTIISGLTRAARAGVIFKGGVYLETLSRAKLAAFDKTGTLTLGKPVIQKVKAVDCQGGEQCEPCDDLLALASSLEYYSTHPLGQAVKNAALDRSVAARYAPAEQLESLSGRGQQGYVNGKLATVGSLPLFEAEHQVPADLRQEALAAESLGQTTMLVCDGDRVRGFLSAQDAVRPEAAQVISALKQRGLRTVMLTGDNVETAEQISGALGLDETYAALLPVAKWKLLGELREKYGHVLMVGDGSNDSPALASADIGIGMGGAGNAQVLETADVVLMQDDLSRLPFALDLSHRVKGLIQQNIAVSLGVKFSVAVLALLGLTPLWVAVLADIGITLAVTLNGMRAMRFQQA
ncbi:MAG: cation-translocating P-type ATPase [Chloroflexi bacterium]|nr:cation-translocating P-type ATPase [Chloroflexota bacterium]HOG77221.1 cation-translocating P-type ATPase [Anaerolineaceae bacterium]